MKVSLIGTGPGDPNLLTAAAREAIEAARLLIGAPRLLEPHRPAGKPCREAIRPADILEILQQEAPETAAVLLSGDLGFYSGAKNLLPLLRAADIETDSIPGISTLQYLCAKLNLPWQDVFSTSAHGRPCDPTPFLREHKTVFFLTGEAPEQTPGALCQVLAMGGFGEARAWVGSRLSYPDEQLFSGTVRELSAWKFPAPGVLLVQREDRPDAWPWTTGIPDEEFIRAEGIPMTKAEVRTAALQKLRVAPEDIIWDIGAGTGSVTVELARLALRGHIYAVERRPEACELIRKNAEKFALTPNILVIGGEAIPTVEALPPPDAVFIGGSGGSLRQIAETALRKNPRARLMIPAVTLETIAEASALMKDLPLTDIEITQLTVAKAHKAGDLRLLRGQNPVFLFRAQGEPVFTTGECQP